MENQPAQLLQGKKTLIPITELFKKTFGFYKTKVFLMMNLVLVSWAVTLVIGLVFGLPAVFLVWKQGGFGLFSLLLLLLAALGIAVVHFWIQTALLCALQSKEAKLTVKNTLQEAKNKIGPYAWVVILGKLITMAGVVLFIIPGIIFSVWFSLSCYVFIFENKKGMQALKRSKELVKGYWWPIFGRILILGLVMCLVGWIIKIGFLINALFIGPFALAYMYYVYEDLKSIKG